MRAGRERRRPVAGHQVLHDRNRLDHRDVAILDRRDEPGWVDGQELRVFLDAGQEVHRPQPVREPHLLQQPDDPEPPPSPKTVIMVAIPSLGAAQFNHRRPRERNRLNPRQGGGQHLEQPGRSLPPASPPPSARALGHSSPPHCAACRRRGRSAADQGPAGTHGRPDRRLPRGRFAGRRHDQSAPRRHARVPRRPYRQLHRPGGRFRQDRDPARRRSARPAAWRCPMRSASGSRRRIAP